MNEQEKSKSELRRENAELLEKLRKIREESDNRKLMLEAVIGHSDVMEADLLRKAKAALAESERHFQVITETIPVPIMVTRESDGSIIYANEPAAEFLGYPVDSLLTLKATEFYDPYDRQRILNIISEQGYLKSEEIQVYNAEDRSFSIELSIQPFGFKDEKCFLNVWYDITQRRTLEKQLRQTRKMEAIGTLAGGIAHDFNNILSIIFGNLELVLNKIPPGDQSRKNLENITTAARRAKEMVRQILAFCRQTELEQKPFQIGSTISEAAKMIRSLLTSDIDVRLQNNVGSCVVMGDSVQIHQVVLNLCSNAAHAMQEHGGVIEIILEKIWLDGQNCTMLFLPEPGEYVRLTVRDNGPGVDKDIAERVFDPFFTTKDPGEGTGMGLAVVHGIVQSHGGNVFLESEPGKGTAFHCWFPIFTESIPDAETDSVQGIRGGGERILFVDDEQNILEVYGEILERLGYQVVTRTDSREALQLFEMDSDGFDLVITDNTMPDMTGKELIRKILEIRPDIPIILCSGTSEYAAPDTMERIGIRGFLLKPFMLNQITGLIRKVFDGKE